MTIPIAITGMQYLLNDCLLPNAVCWNHAAKGFFDCEIGSLITERAAVQALAVGLLSLFIEKQILNQRYGAECEH